MKKPSPETISVGKAIQQSVKRAESAAVVENAIRWCSNIIVELNANHGLNLPNEAQKSLRELTSAIQKASQAIRSH